MPFQVDLLKVGGGEIAVDFLDISVSRFLLKMGVTNRCLKSRCFAVFVCLFVCFLFVCFCQRSQRRTFENMKDPFSKPLTWRNICVYFGSISIDTRSFKHVARQPTFVGW